MCWSKLASSEVKTGVMPPVTQSWSKNKGVLGVHMKLSNDAGHRAKCAQLSTSKIPSFVRMALTTGDRSHMPHEVSSGYLPQEQNPIAQYYSSARTVSGSN